LKETEKNPSPETPISEEAKKLRQTESNTSSPEGKLPLLDGVPAWTSMLTPATPSFQKFRAKDKLPILRGFRVGKTVIVRCPFCDGSHTHPWSPEDDARVAALFISLCFNPASPRAYWVSLHSKSFFDRLKRERNQEEELESRKIARHTKSQNDDTNRVTAISSSSQRQTSQDRQIDAAARAIADERTERNSVEASTESIREYADRLRKAWSMSPYDGKKGGK
jgi:hypothetical protein